MLFAKYKQKIILSFKARLKQKIQRQVRHEVAGRAMKTKETVK